MHLDADLAVGRDVRLGLDVIERRHAVDPAADAVALGDDAVLVPFAFLHGGEHGGGVLRVRDDLVAAALVVELAVPALAVVDLIAAHLGAVRHAHAAHLHAAVDEARAGQAQLEAEVEVLVGLLGREEEVLRHLHGGGAAADLAVLDAPPGGVALPPREGLAVEERDGRGVGEGRSKEKAEAAHGSEGVPPDCTARRAPSIPHITPTRNPTTAKSTSARTVRLPPDAETPVFLPCPPPTGCSATAPRR